VVWCLLADYITAPAGRPLVKSRFAPYPYFGHTQTARLPSADPSARPPSVHLLVVPLQRWRISLSFLPCLPPPNKNSSNRSSTMSAAPSTVPAAAKAGAPVAAKVDTVAAAKASTPAPDVAVVAKSDAAIPTAPNGEPNMSETLTNPPPGVQTRAAAKRAKGKARAVENPRGATPSRAPKMVTVVPPGFPDEDADEHHTSPSNLVSHDRRGPPSDMQRDHAVTPFTEDYHPGGPSTLPGERALAHRRAPSDDRQDAMARLPPPAFLRADRSRADPAFS